MPKHLWVTWPWSRPSRKFLRGHVRTVPGNMLVKFKVRGFNRLGAIIDQSAAHRHKHRHTSNENSISNIYSIHLAEIMMPQSIMWPSSLVNKTLQEYLLQLLKPNFLQITRPSWRLTKKVKAVKAKKLTNAVC